MKRAIYLVLVLLAVPRAGRAGVGLLGTTSGAAEERVVSGRPAVSAGGVVTQVGTVAAREAVREQETMGRVDPAQVAEVVTTKKSVGNILLGVAEGAAISLVPGGILLRSAAGIGLGAAVTAAQGHPFSLGQAVCATAGSLIGGLLFAPIPGGAIIGGIVGGIAGEHIYASYHQEVS